MRIGPLEWGLSGPLLVRKESVSLGQTVRILYASDLHFRATNQEKLLAELSRVIGEEKPDVVLLGGDLVDSTSALSSLSDLVSHARASGALVGAVSGNHDALVGRDLVAEAVCRAGATWLEEESFEWEGLQFIGHPVQKVTPQAVLCSHYPTVFPAAQEKNIKLTFAGHLHGWQIVLWKWGEYLYPGAWLSRWNGLRFERNESVMLVSRGVTDLFPLRWNCPREVLLVVS